MPKPMLDEVGAIVAEAQREAERSSAGARLAAMLALGLLLGVLATTTGRFNPFLAGVYLLNLTVSVVAVRLAGSDVIRPWTPWTLTTLDAVLVFGLLTLGRLGQLLSGAYTPALSASWALFLFLAFVALGARGPGLVLYTTILLAGGLAVLIFLDPGLPVVAETPLTAFGPELAITFGQGPNAFRVALVALTGLVLSLGALRTRRMLYRVGTLARERQNLARHFSAPLATVIAQRDLADLRRGRQQQVGVLFADIRAFTALSETLDPAAVVETLDAFRLRARSVIEGNGGVVDKFIGDAVMGVFGVPAPDGREAAETVAAALGLGATMRAWSAERRRAGLPSVGVGIGAHHGVAFVGAVGDEQRAEFTVIGDTVNVAQRIEEATKAFEVSLLVSRDLLTAAGAAKDDPNWTDLPSGRVRGRAGIVRLCRTANGRPKE